MLILKYKHPSSMKLKESPFKPVVFIQVHLTKSTLRAQPASVRGGYFASLRARAASREPRAASREPRASVCEPQKIPAKKSKNGHNALIWHLLHARYLIYANTRGTFYLACRTGGLAGPARCTCIALALLIRLFCRLLSIKPCQPKLREPDSNNFNSFSEFLT